jgi:hypothetical protein
MLPGELDILQLQHSGPSESKPSASRPSQGPEEVLKVCAVRRPVLPVPVLTRAGLDAETFAQVLPDRYPARPQQHPCSAGFSGPA